MTGPFKQLSGPSQGCVAFFIIIAIGLASAVYINVRYEDGYAAGKARALADNAAATATVKPADTAR